jgi:hypothetical protein
MRLKDASDVLRDIRHGIRRVSGSLPNARSVATAHTLLKGLLEISSSSGEGMNNFPRRKSDQKNRTFPSNILKLLR